MFSVTVIVSLTVLAGTVLVTSDPVTVLHTVVVRWLVGVMVFVTVTTGVLLHLLVVVDFLVTVLVVVV